MTGWTGRILRVDLTTGEHSLDSPDPDVYLKYIGGRGMAGFYLRESVTSPWDSPDMPLLLFAGPLVGTASPTSGRMAFMSRSPLTRTVGDASVGGDMGTYLKRAGLDGVIIAGRSERLCGIEIDDEKVAVTDAEELRGLDVEQTTAALEGKGSIAVVGPAAENGVLFAGVMVDRHHAAGRGGLGASFAAKGIKYVTVKGSGKVVVADPDGLKKAREDIFRLIAASPILLGELGITNFGTGALYDLMHARRMMPTDNFRRTHFPAAPSMNAFAFNRRYEPKRAGCRGCHILCKMRTPKGEALPEFETMSHFSALIGNEDLETVKAANSLCNRMGMDTISAASTLACYSEVIRERLTPEQILSLLEDMASGQGEGAELGKGSYRFAETHGHPEVSISVKGLELPAYDPRGAYGMALAYITSTRGGCHLRAYPISHEILRKPVATDRFTFSGKARIIKIAEDLNAAVDSLTACKFVFFASSLEEYAKAYTAVTGVETTAQDLLKVGERVYYHERIMNARNGFAKDDDDLPPRFFEEPGSSGNKIEVKPIDREEFLEARANYYRVRGLDGNGMPLGEKAQELGLRWSD